MAYPCPGHLVRLLLHQGGGRLATLQPVIQVFQQRVLKILHGYNIRGQTPRGHQREQQLLGTQFFTGRFCRCNPGVAGFRRCTVAAALGCVVPICASSTSRLKPV